MSRAAPLPRAERREAILDAVLPLVVDQGRAVSTRQIAEACGIAEGTIFRVFETKADLVHATLDAALTPTEAMAALDALPEDQTLIQRLAAIIQIVADEMVRTRTLFVTVFGKPPHGQPPKPPDHRPHVKRLELFRTGIATALDPYSDQLSVPIEKVGQLITAVSVAGRMFSPNQQFDDPIEWAELIAHGIAKGNR